jgi:hypothetical protein
MNGLGGLIDDLEAHLLLPGVHRDVSDGERAGGRSAKRKQGESKP